MNACLATADKQDSVYCKDLRYTLFFQYLRESTWIVTIIHACFFTVNMRQCFKQTDENGEEKAWIRENCCSAYLAIMNSVQGRRH